MIMLAEEHHLDSIKSVAIRLYREDRLSANDMRDLAQKLDAVARAAVTLDVVSSDVLQDALQMGGGTWVQECTTCGEAWTAEVRQETCPSCTSQEIRVVNLRAALDRALDVQGAPVAYIVEWQDGEKWKPYIGTQSNGTYGTLTWPEDMAMHHAHQYLSNGISTRLIPVYRGVSIPLEVWQTASGLPPSQVSESNR